MISLYVKNRPWNGQPTADYVRVMSVRPDKLSGFRINGGTLAVVPTPPDYLRRFGGWFHPATAWEIEEFRRLGGVLP